MHKEDPSRPGPSERSRIFYLGRDSHGRWVVQDERHLCGGLFVSEAAALKFALGENGQKRDMVIAVSGVVELDFERASIPHKPAEGPLRQAA